jgi:hypothetical protein
VLLEKLHFDFGSSIRQEVTGLQLGTTTQNLLRTRTVGGNAEPFVMAAVGSPDHSRGVQVNFVPM